MGCIYWDASEVICERKSFRERCETFPPERQPLPSRPMIRSVGLQMSNSWRREHTFEKPERVSANLFWTFHFFAENLESAQNFWIIVKISSHCLWIKTFLLNMSYLYFDNLTLKTLDFHDLRTFVATFCHDLRNCCGLKSGSAIFPLFKGMDGSSSSSVIF